MTQSNQKKNILAHTYLETVWAEYRTEAPLPPELMALTVGYLVEKYEWWENGRLVIQATYVNGEKHGDYIEWHSNGRLYIHSTFVNGKRHGEYKQWYSNGQPYIQTTHVNGKQQ